MQVWGHAMQPVQKRPAPTRTSSNYNRVYGASRPQSAAVGRVTAPAAPKAIRPASAAPSFMKKSPAPQAMSPSRNLSNYAPPYDVTGLDWRAIALSTPTTKHTVANAPPYDLERPQQNAQIYAPTTHLHKFVGSSAARFQEGNTSTRPGLRGSDITKAHTWGKCSKDMEKYAKRYGEMRAEKLKKSTRQNYPVKGKDYVITKKVNYWSPVGPTLHVNDVPPPNPKVPTPATAASRSQFGLDSLQIRRARKNKMAGYKVISNVQGALYQTANNKYGCRAPTKFEIQREKHSGSNAFTTSFNGRLWRDVGFNTTLDKTNLPKSYA